MKRLALILAGLLVVALLATWFWLRPDLLRLDAMIVSAERKPAPGRVIAAILAVDDSQPRVLYRFVRLAGPAAGWRSALLCAIVERRYTPARIAQGYAQNAYLGHTITGVDEASHAYFGVAPAALSDEQIAALIATFYCPNTCSPRVTSESVMRRRQFVLQRMRNQVPPIPFTSSDVWLLLSVAFASKERPADLSGVIARGDAINFAIFNAQELRRGFSNLTKAGYVEDVHGTYSLTDAGRELVALAGDESDVRAMRQMLEQELRASRGPQDDPRFEDPRFPYRELTNEVVARAYHQYHGG